MLRILGLEEKIISAVFSGLLLTEKKSIHTAELKSKYYTINFISFLPTEIFVIDNIFQMTSPRMSIPQAVLNQLSRLSSNRDVIVAVAEQPSNEEQQSQEGQMNIIQEQRPQEIRVIQEPRSSPSQMNGRQTYARAMPIDIPEPMMKQEQEQDQEPEAQATEELRPHCKFL